MDHDFDELKEISKTPIKKLPNPDTKPKVYSLSTNEKAVRDLSDSLDTERAKNILLNGKIRELQKYNEESGVNITVLIQDKEQVWTCTNLQESIGIIDLLLKSLQSVGELQNYSIEPIEFADIDDDD